MVHDAAQRAVMADLSQNESAAENAPIKQSQIGADESKSTLNAPHPNAYLLGAAGQGGKSAE